MANETNITVTGNLTNDPELRFTPSGSAVANFKVAVTARKFDRNSNEWRDSETKFWRCAAWNQGKLTLAENVANTLRKGANVIVQAEIETRSYTTKEGEKRTVDELRVIAIGKNLVFHAQPRGTESQEFDAVQYNRQNRSTNQPPTEPQGWDAAPPF
ncbi:single-stranded DNA-binding protein [Arthrobacter woluwensis]|uniref:Single-stranded DNA-binding protein n=1 Tax=Arthrobacter woluwensis TaxID=156980 RepID=A0A1H4I569_9MICC|nr:single-stranded DNA-binding protein [Arthrobacter woluwensis]SEB29070.1 single stranded DNA-binding protein (ssb) [Arthrobacter woluwensis]SEC53790.1 single stranded DNA-binding protein (ssb) [Arthrobacter woluwensis]